MYYMNIYDVNYVLYKFMYLTCNLLYMMLICIKLHLEQILFHVGIEMEPFRRDDDDEFLENIIREGDDAEYYGSQYLNNTGDGDAAQSEETETRREEMVVQDDTAEVYMEFMLIYI